MKAYIIKVGQNYITHEDNRRRYGKLNEAKLFSRQWDAKRCIDSYEDYNICLHYDNIIPVNISPIKKKGK